jgi:hypothetical protein
MGIYSEIMEGSLGKNRVRRVFMSKKTPLGKGLEKVVNLTSKRALRGGADPKDVASRMTNPSANLRSVQGLQRFQDQARLKSRFPSLRNKVNEATRSKVNKAYDKFGHGSEYSLADLKRGVAVLRRGGASDEIIRSYPAIHARGGYHNKAEITTARGNFMARGMRKRLEKINSPRMTAEGVQRAVRLMNKVLKKNRPVTDTTIATKAYADFIGMNKRQAAKQQRRGGAPESVMKSLTPSAINTRIAAMRKFTETGRAKREAALKAKGKV